jgi:hypothetical protein
MRPHRLWWISLALFVLVALAATTVLGQGRGFTNRSLEGEYALNIFEVTHRAQPGSTQTEWEYCNGVATLRFDGIGMLSATVTNRCNGHAPEVQNFSLPYTVNPDGSFLLHPNDPGGIDVAHGQILDHGRMLFLDGTQSQDPARDIFYGIGVRTKPTD